MNDIYPNIVISFSTIVRRLRGKLTFECSKILISVIVCLMLKLTIPIILTTPKVKNRIAYNLSYKISKKSDTHIRYSNL